MSDYNFVLDHLATGAAINAPADVDQLVAAGITHVINCRAEFDDGPLFVNHPGIAYLWNPTQDDGQPKSVEWFQKSLAFAIPALAVVPSLPVASPPVMHPRVYAHCAAGVNRGPSTAYAIMIALGWPYDLAEQRMRQVRPQVGLAYKGDAQTALTAMGY